MTTDEQNRVTSAIASAIEYIGRNHESALSRLVISELRAAIALVSQCEQVHAERLLRPSCLCHVAIHTLERLGQAIDEERRRRAHRERESRGVIRAAVAPIDTD